MNTKKFLISLISALVFGAQPGFAAGTPQNVSGLEATPVDSTSIGLTWNSALDGEGGLVDHYRVYYGPTSVFGQGGGEYAATVDTPDSNTSYVVSELTPDTTYYFSVTAISSDNLESGEYAIEASAKTLAGEGGEQEAADILPPTVTSVSAPDNMHVKVVFSEAVQLPLLIPEASFSVVEQINPANTLTVNSAVMDASDPTNMTVLLETAEQTLNVNYIVTAGVTIKDLAGNPILSGSTDSGLFLGTDVAPGAETPEEETEGMGEEGMDEEGAETPEEETPADTGEDCESDLNCFVAHLADCSAASVTEADVANQYAYKLELTGQDGLNCQVKYMAEKHPSILYAGADMDCNINQGSYTVESYKAAFDIANCSGALVDGYKEIEVQDTTPPEDITNLLLNFREEMEKFVVIMNWTASIDSAKDLVDQVLYMSLDRGTSYDGGKSLGAVATSTEVGELEGGKEYTFKITTKDAAGNESVGVVKSIRLPATGMGAGLALLGSAAAARRVLRRRRD